jgi:hypothetical protein
MIQMELLSSDLVYDSCEAYFLKNSEGNTLVDQQNGMLLPTIVLTGGFSNFYHEVDITQLKSCTFINKIKSIQQTYSFEDHIEINIDAHYQKGYGSCVFSDPVEVYMQSNWIK